PTRPVAPHEPLAMQRRFEPEMLIGREREFSVLRDAWLEVRQRQPRVMVITGDPGLGKTTLTNTFAASCQMEGAVVARAQAYDAERDLPFAVLAELVKQRVQQRAIGGAGAAGVDGPARRTPGDGRRGGTGLRSIHSGAAAAGARTVGSHGITQNSDGAGAGVFAIGDTDRPDSEGQQRQSIGDRAP